MIYTKLRDLLCEYKGFKNYFIVFVDLWLLVLLVPLVALIMCLVWHKRKRDYRYSISAPLRKKTVQPTKKAFVQHLMHFHGTSK